MLGPNRWPLLLGLPLETCHASPRGPKPLLPVFRLPFFCRSGEPVFGDSCPFHSPGILSLSQLLRDTAPGSQLSASITEASSGTPSLGPEALSMDVVEPLLHVRPATVKESGRNVSAWPSWVLHGCGGLVLRSSLQLQTHPCCPGAHSLDSSTSLDPNLTP